MKKTCAIVSCLLLMSACGLEGPPEGQDADSESSGPSAGSGNNNSGSSGAGAAGSTSSGGPELDPNGNEDADCMTNGEELALGTDPYKADSDEDGFDDCAERDCVSDPLNQSEVCYACGWAHNDPGTLEATGSGNGDVLANFELSDQCGEAVSVWDFYGQYFILYTTAAW